MANWQKSYDNADNSSASWWDVTDGNRSFRCATEEDADFLIGTLTPPSMNEGYQSVPVEPTSAMVGAFIDNIVGDSIWEPGTDDDRAESFEIMLPAYRAMLAVAPQAAVADQPPNQPKLTVRLTSFPESNGKRNWTALLTRVEPWNGLVGNCGGMTLARGEFWNRVAYAAERARFLLGERADEPYILDYGDDIQTPEGWPGEIHTNKRRK